MFTINMMRNCGLWILRVNTVGLIMLVTNSNDKQQLSDSDIGAFVILVSKKWQ